MKYFRIHFSKYSIWIYNLYLIVLSVAFWTSVITLGNITSARISYAKRKRYDSCHLLITWMCIWEILNKIQRTTIFCLISSFLNWPPKELWMGVYPFSVLDNIWILIIILKYSQFLKVNSQKEFSCITIVQLWRLQWTALWQHQFDWLVVSRMFPFSVW